MLSNALKQLENFKQTLGLSNRTLHSFDPILTRFRHRLLTFKGNLDSLRDLF